MARESSVCYDMIHTEEDRLNKFWWQEKMPIMITLKKGKCHNMAMRQGREEAKKHCKVKKNLPNKTPKSLIEEGQDQVQGGCHGLHLGSGGWRQVGQHSGDRPSVEPGGGSQSVVQGVRLRLVEIGVKVVSIVSPLRTGRV
eukprot:GFUD01073903.1.p1 GENE.GFUD01073903.1~~GFUD01073903.1.p1  ORF type:complete len:155 (+),score=39.46 GFUD01073903.1:43-465(+)